MTRSNPSGNMGILFVLLGGGALAYWAYSKGYFGATSPTTTGTTGTGTSTTTGSGATTSGTSPANTSFLTQMAAKIQALAGANAMQTADGWSYDWNVLTNNNPAAPDPLAIFTDPSWDRNSTMSFQAWWNKELPYLQTNMGLSGLMGSYT